jgi:hypothetical protein
MTLSVSRLYSVDVPMVSECGAAGTMRVLYDRRPVL